jgi:hypothetical protein
MVDKDKEDKDKEDKDKEDKDNVPFHSGFFIVVEQSTDK